ncbi:MAG TPA: 50S ribosomal protein L21 [Candidatus Paceibacterota bacterium]|jgi:large subunit ribosomal protein L21|nr:50S ribosomal protein L21 [Candidatus Paceibacterota bacterium]
MAPKKTTKKTAKAAEQGGEFAIIETGGKQYKVASGDVLKIEKLKGDFKEGDTITFDKVLLVDNGTDETTIGTPYISGAAVTARFEKAGNRDKVTVIKYKAKSRYFKKNGHKQPYFQVRIEGIK